MINFLQNFQGVDLLIVLAAYILAVLFAVIPHEVAHGKAALMCGDDTARLAGRLTLNPIKHLDTAGTVCLLLFGFGWAKPVPVNINNFKERKKGLFLVSIAGVLTNLIISFFSMALYVLLLKVVLLTLPQNTFIWYVVRFLSYFLYYLSWINICLMVFNLFPIYPLDGFNLITSLSSHSNNFVMHMQRNWFLYTLALLMLCDFILVPIVSFIFDKFSFFWLSVFIFI